MTARKVKETDPINVHPTPESLGHVSESIAAVVKSITVPCPCCGGDGYGWHLEMQIECDPCHGEGWVTPDQAADIERRYPR
jgi:DnaJ-class molecular chaperone